MGAGRPVAGRRLRAVHAWDLPVLYRGAAFGVLEEDRAEFEDQEAQLPDDALLGWRQKYPEVAVLPGVRLLERLTRWCGRPPARSSWRSGGGRGTRRTWAASRTLGAPHRCPLLLARRH